jgi:serine protease
VAAASNNSTSDQGAPASQLQPGNAPDLNAGRGLVVTAADHADTRAETGYGPQVSLAAYGFYDDAPEGPPGLVSTYPPPPDLIGLECDSPLLNCRHGIEGDRRYAYLQGTSMATPQVAGLAALVADLNPWLSVHDRLVLIKRSARRSGGWSSDLGWGIINAGSAISAARGIDRRPPRSRARSRKRVRIRRGRRRARVRIRCRAQIRPAARGSSPRASAHTTSPCGAAAGATGGFGSAPGGARHGCACAVAPIASTRGRGTVPATARLHPAAPTRSWW